MPFFSQPKRGFTLFFITPFFHRLSPYVEPGRTASRAARVAREHAHQLAKRSKGETGEQKTCVQQREPLPRMLGKPAALFFTKGVTAQLCSLRASRIPF